MAGIEGMTLPKGTKLMRIHNDVRISDKAVVYIGDIVELIEDYKDTDGSIYVKVDNVNNRQCLNADKFELIKEFNALVVEHNLKTSTLSKDQEKARNLGINSVPFFIFNDKYSVSGAQSIENFTGVLNKAYNE